MSLRRQKHVLYLLQKTNIEQIKNELKPVYGGQEFVVTFGVEHRENGLLNTYVVKASVRISGFSAELNFNEVVERLNNANKETLTDKEILDLCNDQR